MSRTLPLVAGLSLLVTAGCRVLPHDGPPPPDVPVPAAWSGREGGGPVQEEAWWRSFGDPALSAAVEEALAANLDLRASAARVVEAAAQARMANGEQWPEISAGANAGRQQQIFTGLPIPGRSVLKSLSTNVGVSLDLSWEADLWGRLRAQADAGAARFAASAWDDRAARESLAGQTAKAWFAWQEARLQQAVAHDTVQSYQHTYDLVQQRFDGGLASAFEVRSAGADLASARALEASRDEEIERAVRQLELLLGRYPKGMVDAPVGLPDMPPPPPAGAPGDLIARRPDLVAAEARLLAADDDLYAARASLYPSLRLTGSVGRSSNRTGDLIDPNFSIWSIAAGLTQPLFAGGKLRANVDLNDARVHEALATFESALLGALGEVETALVAEDRLQKLEDLSRESSTEAEAARSLADERYQAGIVDLLDVLDSQRRVLNAQSQLLSVQVRRLDERVDLHLALGGGFGEPALAASDQPATEAPAGTEGHS